jgi:hypothetical protein
MVNNEPERNSFLSLCLPQLLLHMQSAHRLGDLQPRTLEAYQMLPRKQQWQACKVSRGSFHNKPLYDHLEIL